MLGNYGTTSIILFSTSVVFMLWLDLHAHKSDEPIGLRDAALWSAVWIGVSLLFGLYVGVSHSAEDASLFLGGYVLEKSLAVDNLFVFMAIFESFGIKSAYRHRILYFGIIGALVLRLLFVGLGTSFLLAGQWVLAIFGLVVLWSAWAMWKAVDEDEEEIEDYTNHWSVVYAKKLPFIRPYHKLVGHNFFTRQNAVWYVTPAFLCLICVEFSDIAFAFDSVPAVIAFTQKPFLVYTCMMFAVLGLRSMYFLLDAAKRYLCHLEKAVIAVLVFIGCKLVIETLFGSHLSAGMSLSVVGILLSVGIASSLFWPEENIQNA